MKILFIYIYMARLWYNHPKKGPLSINCKVVYWVPDIFGEFSTTVVEVIPKWWVSKGIPPPPKKISLKISGFRNFPENLLRSWFCLVSR